MGKEALSFLDLEAVTFGQIYSTVSPLESNPLRDEFVRILENIEQQGWSDSEP